MKLPPSGRDKLLKALYNEILCGGYSGAQHGYQWQKN